MQNVNLQMIEEAAERLNGVAQKTPIVSAKTISENVFFKAENLQKTGSFKLRGAYNKICTLSDEEAARGVIACSAGNHAQGVAWSATRRGIKSIVCMPEGAPIMKQEATRNYGAEVVTVQGIYDDAAMVAKKLSEENGYTFVHPFDDPYVIAGQGTIGLEIVEQVPDVEQVIVPIGGGGLISGVAVAIKSLKPDCRIIGVQAATVASMYGSMKAHHITTIEDASTVADGIHVLTPGVLTFNMVNRYVDDIVTVDEDEIYAAVIKLLEGPKLVAEGAGATTLAAFLYDKVDTSLKTVCLISGGNLDLSTFERIFDKGSVKLGRKACLIMNLGDDARSRARLMNDLAECGVKGVQVDVDYFASTGNVNICRMHVIMETSGPKHIEQVRKTLIDKGYELL